MTVKIANVRKGLGRGFLSLALVVAAHSLTHTPFSSGAFAAAPKAATKVDKKAKKSQKPAAMPVGQINLAVEDHYAVVYEKGQFRKISASNGFDPNRPFTAASHIKMLTAIVAFEAFAKNPQLKQANQHLLYDILVHSNNRVADEIAVAVAGSKAEFTKRMQAKAVELKLSRHFKAANASGHPQRGGAGDSFATADDMNRIGVELFRYEKELREVAATMSAVRQPTHSLFFPLPYHPEHTGGDFMFGKTKTDRNFKGALFVPIKLDGKLYLIQHAHKKGDGRPPSATMAHIIKDVFALPASGVKRTAANASYFKWVEDVAHGRNRKTATAKAKAPQAAPPAVKAAAKAVTKKKKPVAAKPTTFAPLISNAPRAKPAILAPTPPVTKPARAKATAKPSRT